MQIVVPRTYWLMKPIPFQIWKNTRNKSNIETEYKLA